MIQRPLLVQVFNTLVFGHFLVAAVGFTFGLVAGILVDFTFGLLTVDLVGLRDLPVANTHLVLFPLLPILYSRPGGRFLVGVRIN